MSVSAHDLWCGTRGRAGVRGKHLHACRADAAVWLKLSTCSWLREPASRGHADGARVVVCFAGPGGELGPLKLHGQAHLVLRQMRLPMDALEDVEPSLPSTDLGKTTQQKRG